jgi:HEAT repeat protein
VTNDPGESAGLLHPDTEVSVLLRAIATWPDARATEAVPVLVALLNHADADVREEAVRRLAVHWRESRARTACLELLQRDCSEGVRATAAYAVAALSHPPTWRQDVRLLLDVAKDPDEADEVRIAAYGALVMLTRTGAPPPLDPGLEAQTAIDWEALSRIERAIDGGGD